MRNDFVMERTDRWNVQSVDTVFPRQKWEVCVCVWGGGGSACGSSNSPVSIGSREHSGPEQIGQKILNSENSEFMQLFMKNILLPFERYLVCLFFNVFM